MNNHHRLSIMDSQGLICASLPLLGKTLACGVSDDCDVTLPLLPAGRLYFIRSDRDAVWVLEQNERGQTENRYSLMGGEVITIAGYRWLVTKEHQTSPTQAPPVSSKLMFDALHWLQQPMDDDLQLRSSLKKFIQLIVQNTSAGGEC